MLLRYAPERRGAHVDRQLPDALDLHLDHVAVAQRARPTRSGTPPQSSRSPGSSVTRARRTPAAPRPGTASPWCAARAAARARAARGSPRSCGSGISSRVTSAGPSGVEPSRERASRSAPASPVPPREVDRDAVADARSRAPRSGATSRATRPITAASPASKSDALGAAGRRQLVLGPADRRAAPRAGARARAAARATATRSGSKLDGDDLAGARHRRGQAHVAPRCHDARGDAGPARRSARPCARPTRAPRAPRLGVRPGAAGRPARRPAAASPPRPRARRRPPRRASPRARGSGRRRSPRASPSASSAPSRRAPCATPSSASKPRPAAPHRGARCAGSARARSKLTSCTRRSSRRRRLRQPRRSAMRADPATAGASCRVASRAARTRHQVVSRTGR